MKKNAFRYLMTYLTAILTAVLNFAYTPQVKADDGVKYEIVTSSNAPSTWSGEKCLIVCSTKNRVLNSNTIGTQKYGDTCVVTINDDGCIYLSENVRLETLCEVEITSITGGVSIKSLNGKYFTNTSSKNQLDVSASPVANTIEFGKNDENLDTVGIKVNKRTLRYNPSSPRFAYYASGQTAIALYKRVEPGSQPQANQHTLYLNLNGADVSELSSFWSNGVTKTDSIFNDNSTTAITLPDISSARDGYTGHWETASQAAPTTGDGTTITSVTPGEEDIYVVAVWTRKSVIVDLSSIAALLQSVKVGNNAAITTGFNNISMTPDDVIIITTKPSVAGKFVALTADKPITLNADGTYTFTFTGSISLTAAEYNVTDFYALKYQAAAGVLTTSGSIDLTGKTLVVLDGKKLCLQDNSAGLVVELGTAASEGMLRKTLTAGTVEGTFAKVGDYVHLTKATVTNLAGTDVTPTPVTTIVPLYTEGSFVQVSGTINNWKVGTYPLYSTTGFGMKQLTVPESTDNFDVTGALYNYNGTLEVLVSSAADFHTAVPAGAPTLTSNANPVNQITITPANKCHAFYAVVAKDAAQPAADAYTEITEATPVSITADADVWTYGVRDFYTNSTPVKTAYQYKTAESYTITVSELGVTRAVACKENENILDKVDEPTNTPFGLTFEYYVNGSDLTTAAKIGATDKPSGAMTIYAVYSYEDAIQKETAFIPAEADDLEDGLTGLIVYDNKCFDGSKTTDIGTANHVDNIQFDADVIYPSQNSTLDLLNRTVTFETCGNGYAVKTKSGVYFNHTGTGAGLESSQTPCEASVQITSGNLSLKIGTFSLRYNNQGAGFFRFYGSGQQDVSFYSQVEVPATVRTLAGDVHTLSYTDTKLSVSIDKDVVPSGSLVQANVLVDVEVTPASGEQVDKLTVNGIDVTFDEDAGYYSFPMPAADATIAVTYKSGTPTAVEDVDAPGAATVVKKVFIDGKVYIVRDGVYYDMNGVRIN